MTDARLSFPLTPWFPVATGCSHSLSLSFPSYSVSDENSVYNGWPSGNWNPVIYDARRGEDSWINVRAVHASDRLAYRYLGKSSSRGRAFVDTGAISAANRLRGLLLDAERRTEAQPAENLMAELRALWRNGNLWLRPADLSDGSDLSDGLCRSVVEDVALSGFV